MLRIDEGTLRPADSAELDSLCASSSTAGLLPDHADAASDGATCSSSSRTPASSAAAALLGGTLRLPPADVLPRPAGGGYIVVRRVQRALQNRSRQDALPVCGGASSCSSSCSSTSGSSFWTAADEARYQRCLQQLKRGLQLALCRRLGLLCLSQVRPGPACCCTATTPCAPLTERLHVCPCFAHAASKPALGSHECP